MAIENFAVVRFMTGKIGENPGYYSLQFMLDEAHKRG